MVRYIINTLVLLLLSTHVYCNSVVYVSSSQGSDNNNGLSELTPFHSISKAIEGGDEIYLRAGDVFYENISLVTKSIRKYGDGNNPTICGYKRPRESRWELVGNNVWRLNLVEDNFEGFQTGSSLKNNIGCIHDYDRDLIHGKKVQFKDKLKEDWDYWQTEHCESGVDASQFDYIYLYLSTNPNLLKLEFSVGAISVRMYNSMLESVNIKGFGFGISANSNCTIRNCWIDAIGGMIQIGASPFVCYGNGIEFYVSDDIENCLVENCYITRCYDCACTIQGSRHFGATPRNIVFKNNLIVGCCQGWEDFLNNGTDTCFENCRFENNVLVYSETGSGYSSTIVRYSHVLGNNYTGNRGMIISNNIFVGGNLYRAGEFDGGYKSNIWINNRFYTTSDSYLLCNYLGTKDYLKIPVLKNEARLNEDVYRRLTDDESTRIYYYNQRKIEKKSTRLINKYLKKHKY